MYFPSDKSMICVLDSKIHYKDTNIFYSVMLPVLHGNFQRPLMYHDISQKLLHLLVTNAEILLIGPCGTNFSEILIENLTFPLKMRLKASSAKWLLFCLCVKSYMGSFDAEFMSPPSFWRICYLMRYDSIYCWEVGVVVGISIHIVLDYFSTP